MSIARICSYCVAVGENFLSWPIAVASTLTSYSPLYLTAQLLQSRGINLSMTCLVLQLFFWLIPLVLYTTISHNGSKSCYGFRGEIIPCLRSNSSSCVVGEESSSPRAWQSSTPILYVIQVWASSTEEAWLVSDLISSTAPLLPILTITTHIKASQMTLVCWCKSCYWLQGRALFPLKSNSSSCVVGEESSSPRARQSSTPILVAFSLSFINWEAWLVSDLDQFYSPSSANSIVTTQIKASQMTLVC